MPRDRVGVGLMHEVKDGREEVINQVFLPLNLGLDEEQVEELGVKERISRQQVQRPILKEEREGVRSGIEREDVKAALVTRHRGQRWQVNAHKRGSGNSG